MLFVHSSRRLHLALAAALCAHIAIAAALRRVPRSSAIESAASSPSADLFFLSDALPESPRSPEVTARVPSAIPRAGAAARLLTAHSSPPAPPKTAIEAPSSRSEDTPPSTGNSEGRSSATAPIDLGLASLWKDVAIAGARSTNELSPRDHLFREAHDAHDRELGLGPSAPVVAAAREAGSIPSAPDTGNAVFEVNADASGKVLSASVVSFSADGSGWIAVAQQLVAVMGSKTLRLPVGAHGFRVRLRISAERTLPSGQRGETHAGAVPDDVPGADPVCEGTGWMRKCTKGMPLGATMSTMDVANLAAGASRIVRAHILGEQTL